MMFESKSEYLATQFHFLPSVNTYSFLFILLLGSSIDQSINNSGLPSLGLLNPTLYAHPDIFYDITSGNNKGTENFMGLYGYTTAIGWDPVTGVRHPILLTKSPY